MRRLQWVHHTSDVAFNIHQADDRRECVASVWTTGYADAELEAARLAKLFAAAPRMLEALRTDDRRLTDKLLLDLEEC